MGLIKNLFQVNNKQQQQESNKMVAAPRRKCWQLEAKFTLAEVSKHQTLDDCWMVIFDKVYDITQFVNDHPGGEFILLEYAGRDATQPFLNSRHGSSAYKMLDKYWIGILVDEELFYSNNSSYCSVYSNLSWKDKCFAGECELDQVEPKPGGDDSKARDSGGGGGGARRGGARRSPLLAGNSSGSSAGSNGGDQDGCDDEDEAESITTEEDGEESEQEFEDSASSSASIFNY